MTININTSEYTTYKKAIIDGIELGVRAMSTAETLEVASLQEQLSSSGKDKGITISRFLDILFNLFDKPDKARKILSNLPADAIADVYKRIMESE